MIVYRCCECGRTFDQEELAFWDEDRGEFWGQKCYERMSGCPYCFSGDVELIDDDEEGWDVELIDDDEEGWDEEDDG